MSKSLLIVFIIGVLLSTNYSAFAAECINPEIQTTSFTSQDATIVSQIAFIAEFSLKCAASTKPLFAEVDGRLSPVVRVSDTEFQVSWTEDTKKARRGERLIRLFTEDGFAAVRKVQRAGGDIQSVEPLATISVNHGGAFSGPWINSEILAAGISAIVAYVAFSTRSKLLS